MINKHKQRFYWLSLIQDLFGTWCVYKVYGGLANKHSRCQLVVYPDRMAASKAMMEIEVIRRKRGYTYADIDVIEHFNLKPQTIKDLHK
jgi:predicted DNA-binding WGR domain protein